MILLATKLLIKLQKSLEVCHRIVQRHTNETENIEIVREIPKQRYIFTEKRKQIIDY